MVASDSDAIWEPASNAPPNHSVPTIAAITPMEGLLTLQATIRRTLVSRWYSATLIRFSNVLHKIQRLEVKSEVCKPSRLPSDYAETEDIVEFVQESLVHAQRRAQAIVRKQAMKKEISVVVGDSIDGEQPAHRDALHSIRQRMMQPKVMQTRVKNSTAMDIDCSTHGGHSQLEASSANRFYEVGQFCVAGQGHQVPADGAGYGRGIPAVGNMDQSGQERSIVADLRRSRGYIEAEGLARLGVMKAYLCAGVAALSF